MSLTRQVAILDGLHLVADKRQRQEWLMALNSDGHLYRHDLVARIMNYQVMPKSMMSLSSTGDNRRTEFRRPRTHREEWRIQTP